MTSRTSIRLAALLMTATLVVGAAACSSGSSKSKGSTTHTIKASADLPDFYAVPDPLPTASPGTILHSEPVDVAGLHGAMSRVMYMSTSVKGDPIAVTGLIAIPKGDAPADGWPVISWAHGTTGIADSCTPSLKPDGFTLEANLLLDAGYLVVATDFEGLGTPGRHPYMVGHSEAYGTLDIVKAAQIFPGANASKDYIVWGHSQGGHAALFAGHDAQDYAPDLNLKGVVAGAPPSQLLLINAALQTSAFKYYIAMTAAGFNAAFGDSEAPLGEVLTQQGIDWLANVDAGCTSDLSRAATGVDFAKLQLADPATVPEWSELLKNNDPQNFFAPIAAPLLIVHGGADEQIPVASSGLLFNQLCTIGQVGQRWVFDGQSHAGVLIPSVAPTIKWMSDRFANRPMPDPLSPAGATVQSCGQS